MVSRCVRLLLFVVHSPKLPGGGGQRFDVWTTSTPTTALRVSCASLRSALGWIPTRRSIQCPRHRSREDDLSSHNDGGSSRCTRSVAHRAWHRPAPIAPLPRSREVDPSSRGDIDSPVDVIVAPTLRTHGPTILCDAARRTAIRRVFAIRGPGPRRIR